MKTIAQLALAALAVISLSPPPIAQAGAPGPTRLNFEKCWVADPEEAFQGHFEGTVTGDCGNGEIAFTYISVEQGKSIWRFSGAYAVSTPECSFTAVCEGNVDIRTGRVVLNGVVTESIQPYHLGARVHIRAQGNEDLSCSAGTMTLTPGGAEPSH